MSFQCVCRDDIARITLDRPERHNAFDDGLIADLTACLDRLADDASLRVVVLGATGKSFSAGADLAWMRRMADYGPAENLLDARALAGLMRRLDTMPMPVIARIQGPAIGGGVGLVACCDIAIASDQAFFQLSEVRLGLTPATISPYVIRAIGPRAARRYFVTAERISAAQAENLGLVHEVVPMDGLDVAVDRVIEAIVAGGAEAVRAAKKLVLDYAFQDPANLMDDSADRIAERRASPEAQARLRAFLERS